MVTSRSRGISQVFFICNCLISIVCSEWMPFGYDYNDGGDFYGGYGGSSSRPPVVHRAYYGHNTYRPTYEYGGGRNNNRGGYGSEYGHESRGGYYGNKPNHHPDENKRYGYEKHDYRYEKQYYDNDNDGYDNDNYDYGGHGQGQGGYHGGYGQKEHGYGQKEHGYGQKEHGHGSEKGDHGHATSGYGKEKKSYGGGSGGKEHPPNKLLYGYCYNDYDCPMSQCCLKQSGTNACFDLDPNSGACSRRRECRHQQDCPSRQCCFPRNPNNPNNQSTQFNTNSKSYATHGGYGPYGHGTVTHPHINGVCQPAGMRGQPCTLLLKGIVARDCPCATGLTCNIPSGSNIGTCQ